MKMPVFETMIREAGLRMAPNWQKTKAMTLKFAEMMSFF